MSADLLRAAALMRERAEKATPSADPQPGGWDGWVEPGGYAALYGGPSEAGYRSTTVLEFKDNADCEECVRPSLDDMDHIASWHPAVALAVADWLDGVRLHVSDDKRPSSITEQDAALAVARAYLGRDG